MNMHVVPLRRGEGMLLLVLVDCHFQECTKQNGMTIWMVNGGGG